MNKHIIRRVANGYAHVNPEHAFATFVAPGIPVPSVVSFGPENERQLAGSPVPHHVVLYDRQA